MNPFQSTQSRSHSLFFSLLCQANPNYLNILNTQTFETVGASTYPVINVSQYKEFPTASMPNLKAVDTKVIFKPNTAGLGL